jgi:hypothetical protein
VSSEGSVNWHGFSGRQQLSCQMLGNLARTSKCMHDACCFKGGEKIILLFDESLMSTTIRYRKYHMLVTTVLLYYHTVDE